MMTHRILYSMSRDASLRRHVPYATCRTSFRLPLTDLPVIDPLAPSSIGKPLAQPCTSLVRLTYMSWQIFTRQIHLLTSVTLVNSPCMHKLYAYLTITCNFHDLHVSLRAARRRRREIECQPSRSSSKQADAIPYRQIRSNPVSYTCWISSDPESYPSRIAQLLHHTCF